MNEYFLKINQFYFSISILATGFIFANVDFDIDGDGQYDNLSEFNFDANITGIIEYGSIGVVGEDYLVGKVDDEIRGVGIASHIPFGPYQGSVAYLTTVGSYDGGSTEIPGETISFYFYDAELESFTLLNETIDFISNLSLGDLENPFIFTIEEDTPALFEYNQSTLQAFYLFNNVNINGKNIDSNDWVGAFKGDVCVGARKWDVSECGGNICDVPVMGRDGSEVTKDYMLTSDVPTFKIYDSSENIYYDANSNDEICEWSNGNFCGPLDNLYYGSLDISNIENVDDYSIIKTYPNPFNPVINIDFNLKISDYLDIRIFDMNGQEIDKIFQGYKVSGKYNYKWDASGMSSGIYFVIIKKLMNSSVLMEKICLIK